MLMTEDQASRINRRTFLTRTAMGLGGVALNSMLNPSLLASPGGFPGAPHHKPRIKRVIWLTMAGGPSHLETWDPKPVLGRMHGKPMPESMTKGQQLAQLLGG